MVTAYLMLAASIAFEMVSASMTTATKGWTVLKPTVITVFGYFMSYFLFGLCLSDIDLSVGYATWGAVGTVVTPIVGYLIYKEKITKIGIAALVMIIVFTITLNLWG